jgi:hypothetical protein
LGHALTVIRRLIFTGDENAATNNLPASPSGRESRRPAASASLRVIGG